MYAIIEAGGTQHLVREGQFIKVNDPNLPIGQEVIFDKVKMVSRGDEIAVGQPNLEDITVSGQVRKLIAGPKIKIHKYRRRKSSESRQGHRQKYSLVQISRIGTGREFPPEEEVTDEAVSETPEMEASDSAAASAEAPATETPAANPAVTDATDEKES